MNTKVMLAIPTTESIRNASFFDYFNLIQKPAGTVIASIHLQSPAHARNTMIQQALDLNCTHILFLDDDMAPLPTIITDLLKHDKDIVTGLYLSRQYPHFPIIFKSMESEGCGDAYLSDSDKGLIEIKACGLGCCLIKLDVFMIMEKPWIRLGELTKDHWCDDVGFFIRTNQLGYKVYCDLDSPCGHMGTVTIRPHRVNGKWFTSYSAYSTECITFPQHTLEYETLAPK